MVRQAGPGDLNYIYSTLLRDLRDADPSGLPDDLWFPPHRAWLDRTLADPSVTCLVAAASDAPREILGYVLGTQGEVLEWVHVRKGALRERGIAKMLLLKADLGPATPTRWTTRLGRARLQNPHRSRQLRRPRPAASSSGPA